jgi:hypothetical protein
MPISRALYVGQSVSLLTNSGQATFHFPVSSASCEVSKPIDSVSAFGHLNSLATAQTNLTTCRASIKAYLTSGAVHTTGAGGVITAGSGITAGAISCLTGDAINGNLTVITVSPNGFTMSGILTSLGIDMSLGGFGMADLGFVGIGQPFFAATPTSSASPDQASMPSSIVPVTTVGVSGSVTGAGCASSFKFSLDMPTDNLACLGSNPDEVQNANQQSLISTKPPYKATISVEGFGVDVSSAATQLSAAITGNYSLGGLHLRLPNPKVSNKSFNNAVGNAGASYNYTVEDTTAVFS